MTTATVPSLITYVESHIIAMYNATSETDTSNVIDKFLSKNATIKVNGKNVYRTDLIKELQSDKFLEVGASVKFMGCIAVPANEANPNDVIGLYFLFKIFK